MRKVALGFLIAGAMGGSAPLVAGRIIQRPQQPKPEQPKPPDPPRPEHHEAPPAPAPRPAPTPAPAPAPTPAPAPAPKPTPPPVTPPPVTPAPKPVTPPPVTPPGVAPTPPVHNDPPKPTPSNPPVTPPVVAPTPPVHNDPPKPAPTSPPVTPPSKPTTPAGKDHSPQPPVSTPISTPPPTVTPPATTVTSAPTPSTPNPQVVHHTPLPVSAPAPVKPVIPIRPLPTSSPTHNVPVSAAKPTLLRPSAAPSAAAASAPVVGVIHHTGQFPVEPVHKPILIPPLPKHGEWHKPNPEHHHAPPPKWVGIRNHVRVGFVWLFGIFGSEHFNYDSYESDSSDGGCEPSPWYYYPDQPPYIQDDNVQPPVSSDPAPDGTVISVENLKPAVVEVMSNLTQAWEHDDEKAISALLPSDGAVQVSVESGDSYSLKAADFGQLFNDGIEHVHTNSYKVVEVDQLPDGKIEIHTEHKFQDPWDQPQTIDHAYVISLEADGYVIREFRSSTYR